MRRASLFILVALLGLGCGDDPVTRIEDPPRIYLGPTDIIGALSQAYQTRDYDFFVSLLANDPDRNAQFTFKLHEPTEDGVTEWGFETEARVHRRMFCPDCPGFEFPLPDALWIESININLSLQTNFTERHTLYSKDNGKDGLLDPRIWKTHATTYSTDVFFAMAGELDYQVNGFADFVIIEDLTKSDNEPDRFLLFIWEDLGSSVPRIHVEHSDWSQIKDLYRRF